ncbi:MAG TPA: hypothetical protein VFD70_07205 [Anaerolineae bacterium]|nr:hypothetical protein [Anaerolineae bacterium]
MQRKGWLGFAAATLMCVGFLLQGAAQADSPKRPVDQGDGTILREWTPSPIRQDENENDLRITPSIGRIGSTTFYVIGFGFTPNESITCKRISPNGQESKLHSLAASQAGALLFAYEVKRANQMNRLPESII